MNTVTVKFTLATMPSSSKGWARYKAAAVDGANLIESRTGNEWVSAPHDGETVEGAEFCVDSQTMLKTQKTRTGTLYARRHRLVAEAGATCRIGAGFHNSLTIDIQNARMIGEVEL